MDNRYKTSTSQLLNFAQDSYLERTSRPVYAMVFLLPFIVFYELGTILINTDVLNQSQVRVVAFVWLQNFLAYLGFGSKMAWAMPAVAVVIMLTALQLTSRKQWRFYPGDMWVMAIECILLAVPLIVLSLFLSSSNELQSDVGRFANSVVKVEAVQGSSAVRENSLLAATVGASGVGSEAVANSTTDDVTQSEDFSGGVRGKSALANIVTGIGAGIYEELIFRLILICVLMVLFQDVLRLGHKKSIILSVLISATLFSAHHHIIYLDGQLNQSAAFSWMEFSFRTIAGVYFAVLFAIRGFGITAGTHAFYDIIATVINSTFFQQ